MIYFDHNATTPTDSRVLEVMLPFFESFYGNPSGLYKLARLARSAIDTAREQVAQLVNVRAEHVIFTSGGTEANNLALRGCHKHAKLLLSAFEHPSILDSEDAKLAAVNSQGYIDLKALESMLNQPFDLASFMLVNNETGVIQDIAYISSLVKESCRLIHTDAIQAAGKIPIDFSVLGVDLMSISSHKMYGPKGVGALITSAATLKYPLLTGGGQESGLRAGTENVPAIVGFGKAAELARIELQVRHEHCFRLRTYLETALLSFPSVELFGKGSHRVANTVQFGVKNCVGDMLLMKLDQHGIAVSSGSACASHKEAQSHVLVAMGVDSHLAKSAIRVSFGVCNTLQEVDFFIQKLKQILSEI